MLPARKVKKTNPQDRNETYVPPRTIHSSNANAAGEHTPEIPPQNTDHPIYMKISKKPSEI